MTTITDAPVADWVSIPELYADPFPTFERLRAEGGVHWVPAVNRYLVTSYAAVHDTEMDQQTFSANEKGSLMIRAMGHSMLRKDDPDHAVERRAWQPVLRPSVVKKSWLPIFERNAERYLELLREKGPGADLVWDFAAPFAAENLRAITGLHNVTQEDLQRWSQTMIDATGNYADDPAVWARGESSFDEVDDALDEMIGWHRRHPDSSLLSALLALPGEQMPIESIRANLKMTIGGGLNEPRDAIGVAAWALMRDPAQRALVETDPSRWHAVFDETIRWVAPIGMYSRQTTRDVDLQGVRLPAGAKLGICLLSANRDEQQWLSPERFDLTRSGQGAHLAFGKGVHVCLGAWVARAEVADVALPALFKALPGLDLHPERPAVAGGWVFRGMDALPVTFDTGSSGASTTTTGGMDATSGSTISPARASTAPSSDPAHSTASPVATTVPPAAAPASAGAISAVSTPAEASSLRPHVAIIGAGPAGCYTAQAVLRRLPGAQVTVYDARPTPYGLVRSGVAADHQGTKAVADQFARLFDHDGVRFVGSTRVHTGRVAEDVVLRGRPAQDAPAVRSQDAAGAELTLQQLRDTHDAVVVATGLTGDVALAVPGALIDGAPRPGLFGSGELTRLLNGDPAACVTASLPTLGRSAVVVGMGNVAMDLIRLTVKRAEHLADSDIHDEAHTALTRDLTTLHVVGRSLPATAKFDPVMLREILDLPGIEHVVHGVSLAQLEAAGDPRSELVAELIRSGVATSGAGVALRVEWWIGYVPAEVHGHHQAAHDEAGDAAGGEPDGEAEDRSVEGLAKDAKTLHVGALSIAACDQAAGAENAFVRLDADAVVTAIGFHGCADDLVGSLGGLEERTRETGRIEPGLYVAGWARRGPYGTIPSQRTDSRELAETIAADLAGIDAPSRSSRPSGPARGYTALVPYLGRATDWAGWRRVDAEELARATAGRIRGKLRDTRELRLLASAAVGAPERAVRGAAEVVSIAADLPPLTVLFGTESGNAELGAEELGRHLADRFAITIRDIGTLDTTDVTAALDRTTPHLLVCSTYGDGELPTTARGFHQALLEQKPDLTGLRYAMFGLGDRSYPSTYSRGSEILDETLRRLGAERVGDYGRHDAASGTSAAENVLPWVDRVVESCAART
ncbi:cytochrome P450 [Tersicoccus sp. Bi-70]|uniref:cytochrome P450 n=1 Tax=Tersicoccus sp. Bi-70 TaxID=1897634 RepID=UPI000978BB2E|nr:cytochrome P450 [Tersicoccus sp. Bi-70]